MNSGKNKSLSKTRQPYGRVNEVGQVPVALMEISELAGKAKLSDWEEVEFQLAQIKQMADSIIAVTCANLGCLSQMAEDSKPGYAQIVERVFNRIPQSRESHISNLVFESKHVAIRFDWMGKTYRVNDWFFPEEVTPLGLERSREAQDLDNYLEPEWKSSQAKAEAQS